ncbi:hypothetical protein [Rossellomorea aquimaris]|uniref:hypothetical protein n=1 Tax=Rossellomorea aquimaris TaxID=189382 RepID=UPI0007D0851E|nr:hypothetical protein [Rossellomorea aquimaris]
MFLTESKPWNVIKKQFFYKLKAYRGVYTSMIVIQLLALLFSLGGMGMGGGGSAIVSYEVNLYSVNLIIGFMMIWAFIISIVTTTKAYREDDFTFVTNRFTSHLSTILFLITASIVGAITTFLAGYTLKVIMFFITKGDIVTESVFQISIWGFFGLILYLLLFASFGYTCGMLVQMSKIFIILIPALLFGSMFLMSQLLNKDITLAEIGLVFAGESSFLIFLVKIFITVIPLLGLVTMLTNRMEVRS